MNIEKIDDDEFFVALGQIAYSGGRMSAALEELIMGILAMSDGVAVVTADLNYSQLNHLANALADRLIKGKEEFAHLTRILDDASRWYEVRNKVMHGEWRGGFGWFWCTRFRAKGKLVMIEDQFKIGDLFAVAAGLEGCRARLEKFTERKRFLERTMFDEDVGVRRLARRIRSREREKARIRAQERQARLKQRPQQRRPS
jgi:hypothetical protein